MRPCPRCGYEPICDMKKGYVFFVDITCRYKTWPRKEMDEAVAEWEVMIKHVAQWMIDGKIITYGVMDRFLEDTHND